MIVHIYEITGQQVEKLKMTQVSSLSSHGFTFCLAAALSTGLACDSATLSHPVIWYAVFFSSVFLSFFCSAVWYYSGDERAKTIKEIEETVSAVRAE